MKAIIDHEEYLVWQDGYEVGYKRALLDVQQVIQYEFSLELDSKKETKHED